MPREVRNFVRTRERGKDYARKATQLLHAKQVILEAQRVGMMTVDAKNFFNDRIRNHSIKGNDAPIAARHTRDMDTHSARLNILPHRVELTVTKKKLPARPPAHTIHALPGQLWKTRKIQFTRIRSKINAFEENGWISPATTTEILKMLAQTVHAKVGVLVHAGQSFKDRENNTEVIIRFEADKAIIQFHPLE